MITSAQGYYDLGYREGQHLYSQSPMYQQSDLHKIANQNIAAKSTTSDDAIPMVMQAQYRDGLIAGYEAMKKNSTYNKIEKRQA
jgi:hypothetical protein